LASPLILFDSNIHVTNLESNYGILSGSSQPGLIFLRNGALFIIKGICVSILWKKNITFYLTLIVKLKGVEPAHVDIPSL